MADKEDGVRLIKADLSLQKKIGTGDIPKDDIVHAQAVMDEDRKNVDFAPMAERYLQDLAVAIQAAQAPSDNIADVKESMTVPVMQLKAHAKMFHYDLISILANIMLRFLEAIDTLDDDAVKIVDAHQRSLSLIVSQKMVGDGGAGGKAMEKELKAVCDRYLSRLS